MPDCSFLASDIQFCQSKGKIVTISLGGATGAASFTSDDQASAFGDTIWNTFLGGTSSVRPFGSAVLDGYVPVTASDGMASYALLQYRLGHRRRRYCALCRIREQDPHPCEWCQQAVLRDCGTSMPLPRRLHVHVSTHFAHAMVWTIVLQ